MPNPEGALPLVEMEYKNLLHSSLLSPLHNMKLTEMLLFTLLVSVTVPLVVGASGGPSLFQAPKSARTFFLPTSPGSNLFNTSVAFTLPLFSINTQALTGARSLANTARTFLDGLDSGAGFPPIGSGVVASLAIPALVAGVLILLFDVFSRPFLLGSAAAGGRAADSIFSGGLGGITEYLLTFVENSLDHVPSIDGEECIKRSVCEAHNNPTKYGLVALPLQLLFPPYPYSGTDDTSKMSKYQLAARYGKSDNANCGVQYSSCVINPLDLIHTFARMVTDLRR